MCRALVKGHEVVRRAFLALCGLLWAASPAWADVAPDARPIAWQQCKSGGTTPSAITAGGTAQPLIGASVNFPIRALLVENPTTASEPLYLNLAGTAAIDARSMSIAAGVTATLGPGTTITNSNPSVIATTTGHAFTCWFGQ